MIKNYFIVALRALMRNRMTATINLVGLALAMSAAILIYLFVTDELSFDRYHRKAERTYRVTRIFYNRDQQATLHLSAVAPPIGPLLKNDFGEIETLARTLQYNAVVGKEAHGEVVAFSENNVFLAEPSLFNILDIQVLSGSPLADLGRPNTVMLANDIAEKYFPNENAIGKRLRFDNTIDLEVVGTFQRFPAQSHWHPDFLISFATLEDDAIYGRRNLETNWGNNSFTTYLTLAEGATAEKLQQQFPAFLDRHFGPFAKANYGVPTNFIASKSTALTLQNIRDIHLHSHLDDEIEVNGNINNVYMMSVIGIFIVLIACFNFINLSTARATKRAKEVGLRKAVGAIKSQLINQYLSESVLLALFSLAAAVGISLLGLDAMNQFTNKQIELNFLLHWQLLLGVTAFAIVVGLIAGIYPAFVISSFKPALVLKGQQGQSKGKGGIRKALVVAQFAISITLIIATAVTFQQLDYLNSRDLGYNRHQVITLSYYSDLNERYDSFYNELLQSSAIRNVGLSSRIPTGRLLDSQGTASVTKGDSLIDTGVSLKYVSVDPEFFDTFGITLAAGRSFDKKIVTDDSLAFVINEAAAQAIGWKNAEEGVDQDFSYGNTKGKLIGVVKDFHFESLHEQVVPMVFIPRAQGGANYVSIKFDGQHVREGIAHLEKIWKQTLPGNPFEYQFMDDRYSILYEAEKKEGTLFIFFSGLAIFIASLGLFGLATFNAVQRIKEIGIRKVLGASVSDIVRLLSREIVMLVIIANLIAWPVAWYSMTEWLNSFAYHTTLNVLVFAGAAVSCVLIALMTVSLQTIRAAMSNPASTLRSE